MKKFEINYNTLKLIKGVENLKKTKKIKNHLFLITLSNSIKINNQFLHAINFHIYNKKLIKYDENKIRRERGKNKKRNNYAINKCDELLLVI